MRLTSRTAFRQNSNPLETSLAAVAACALISAPVEANDGMPDVSFNGTGIVRLPGALVTQSGALAFQSDGKIVMVLEVQSSTQTRAEVYRFLPDGRLDTTFGTGGKVQSPVFGSEVYGWQTAALYLVEGGRILVIAAVANQTRTTLWLARWNANGTPDETFAPGGFIPSRFVTSGYSVRYVRQHDGAFLCGTTSPRTLFRVKPDGFLDEAFGDGGIIRYERLSSALAQQANGHLVMDDHPQLVGGAFALLRKLPDGSPDMQFGSGGRAQFSVPGHYMSVEYIVPLHDGRILAGGRVSFTNVNDDPPQTSVVRFLPDGRTDMTFGDGAGIAIFSHERGGDSLGKVLAMDDGRIITAGYSGPNVNDADITIGRLLPGGSLDPGFGIGGKVRADLGSADRFMDAGISPGGRLFVLSRNYPPSGSLREVILTSYTLGVPRLRVIDPAGNFAGNAPPAPQQDLGVITLGSRTRQYTIRNAGTGPLTGLQISLTNVSHPGEFLFTQPAATTLAPYGAETTFIITLQPAAGAAPGVRSATVNLSSTTPSESPLQFTLTGAKATPLQIWRVTWFGSPDNSGTGTDGNDFDGDGMSNLVEYATGLNPHQYSPPPGLASRTAAGVTFTYTRPAAAVTDVSYVPEISASPDGPWSDEGLSSTVISDDGTTQTIEVAIPGDAARRFFHLRVTPQ